MKEKGNRNIYLEDKSSPTGFDLNFNAIKDVLKIEKGKHRNLLRVISDPIILLSAFERIVKNSGYYSKGVDNTILLSVNKEFFLELSKELNTGSYNPKPSRRVLI